MPEDQKGLFEPIAPERNGNGKKLERLFVPKLLREAADNRRVAVSLRRVAHLPVETPTRAAISSAASLAGTGLFVRVIHFTPPTTTYCGLSLDRMRAW